MKFLFISLFIILLFTEFSIAVEKGIITLDEYTFDKVVDGSKYVLVEFIYQPWETTPDLETVGREFDSLKDVLICKFIISANEEFAKRFDFKKEELPAIKLYPKGSTTFENLVEGSAKTIKGDDVVELLRFRLNPNLKELKDIAAQFVAEDAKRTELLKRAEILAKNASGKDLEYASQFIKSMNKIIEKGVSYVSQEKTRLTKMTQSSSVTEKNKK